jgi:lysine 2,3-aminomutase
MNSGRMWPRATRPDRVSETDWNDWRWQMRNRITDPAELAVFLGAGNEQAREIAVAAQRFPLAVTPCYASLIDLDDPACPIRAQVVPSVRELTDPRGMPDPLDEVSQSPVPGVVQIYPDRVAFLVSGQCASLCRFCYRKRLFDPDAVPRDSADIEAGLDYIREHPEIRDVLVTGGDPLTASDEWLHGLLSGIRAIPHVEIIRIGTRTPVTLPQRITPELCDTLAEFHPIWLNTQFNHPRELTDEAATAVDRLTRAGIPVGNQSVLLQGINDSPEVMRKLVHGLVRMRVRPYYVFLCHLVSGTSHFRTTVEKGVEIARSLRGHTSGIANPLFILDTPHGKVPIMPGRGITGRDNDGVDVETWNGHTWREWNPVDIQE